jgi:hypothetical protein
MGFAPLQHLQNRRSTCRGPETCPLRSAFRVWLPSWRFAPSETSPALFHADSALGVHPSEPSPPARYPDVGAGKHPLAVCPGVASADEATDRTTKPRLLGFGPHESPLRHDECLARRPPDAPLGLLPSRVSGRKPCRRLSPPAPPSCLAGTHPDGTRQPAPRSFNQPSPRPPEGQGT